MIVAVHSTVLGQAVGGCRMWRYDNWTHGLEDALRLSNAMTLKCAVSGLPLGGGKSVIALPSTGPLTPELRRAVLHDLGDVIDSLGGAYGAGEDVGTTAADMMVIGERTQHVYGLPVASGGMGEPSVPTAVGVYEAIRVTCRKIFGSSDLSGRAVTVIGLGQVGSRIAERLAAEGARLTVNDIDQTKQTFAAGLGASWVSLEEAVTHPADVLVPAALGGLLDPQTARSLRCAAVVGPANNQLTDDAVADVLEEHGVLWAPDFLVNAGGVVYGASIEMGNRTTAEAMAEVRRIGDTLHGVYETATLDGITPMQAAQSLAQARIANAREKLTHLMP